MNVTEHDARERHLIESAQRDPSRFAELYQANFDRVYAFVARRIPTREEAEDLTAEVFVAQPRGIRFRHKVAQCVSEANPDPKKDLSS